MSKVCWSTGALRIFGADLEPDDITQLLGTAPTKSYRRGDPIYPPKNVKPRPVGAWILETDKEWKEGDRLNDGIRALLRSLPGDVTLWQDLARRFDMDMYCGTYVTDTSPEFRLERDTLKMLADRDLQFEICIYIDDDSIRAELETRPTSDTDHPRTK